MQNQGIEHYWQQARIDRLHWASASYPSNVILLIFDGQKAERIPTYRRVSHDRHTLFVFRKPTSEQRPTTGGAFAPKSTSQTAEAEPEGKVLAYDIPNAMDTIHTAKPIMLQLHQLGWDKRTFTFEEEPITGWFSVTNIAGSEGKKLNLIVKDDNDEQGRRILSQLTITLKRNQTRYAFEVADLKADEVFDDKTGDLRFSVKGLRFDGQFSGPATLIKPTQLTIAQIAEQLV
ncbi:MAG: hypothetical protein P8X89_08425, partial [Reinekea sp.]